MSERNRIRQQIRTIRRALSPAEQQSAACALQNQLANHPLINRAKRIAIYLANDGELDTEPAIHWFWQQGIAVCLPILHPFTPGHLLFMHYHPATPMQSNKFGIKEPLLACHDIIHKRDIDIVFTPLVAFDAEGNRLGMGGGFYDRTLEHWHKHKEGPYPIGLAHDCQECPRLPTADWDVPLAEVITPTRRLHWEI